MPKANEAAAEKKLTSAWIRFLIFSHTRSGKYRENYKTNPKGRRAVSKRKSERKIMMENTNQSSCIYFS